MRYRNLLALLAVLFSAFMSEAALSADYFWQVQGQDYTSAPTPSASCAIYAQGVDYPGGNNVGVNFVNTKQYVCSISPKNGPGGVNVFVWRLGDSCSPGSSESAETGLCMPPSDGECKTRDPYTKTIQFSCSLGGCVLDTNAEIKEHCVYESGTPENCTATSCEVKMTPAGNDDTSDNSENPDQDIQDYLDELAKQFKCEKTANGTIGCTGSQTSPPDIDPDDKCPPGYSWTGTTCVKTDGNGNQNPGTPGGGTGGNNGGGTGGGDGGSNPGTGGDGGGDGGNNGGSGGGDDGNGGGDPKEKLEKPKAGNFNDANDEWDARLKESKDKFKEKVEKLTTEFKGVLNLNLGEGAGKLPCYQFTITAFVKPVNIDLCTEKYSDPLSYLRYILLAIAGLIAGFVILRK